MGAIEVHNLSKSYGKVQALDCVSFSVERVELFGLIGPDGAGKTTLFRLLTTLLNPDSGSAEVDGCDTAKDYLAIRSRVGYMPGRFSLYPDLSVEENLPPKTIQTKDSRANLVYAVKIAVKNDGRLKIGLSGEVVL